MEKCDSAHAFIRLLCKNNGSVLPCRWLMANSSIWRSSNKSFLAAELHSLRRDRLENILESVPPIRYATLHDHWPLSADYRLVFLCLCADFELIANKKIDLFIFAGHKHTECIYLWIFVSNDTILSNVFDTLAAYCANVQSTEWCAVMCQKYMCVLLNVCPVHGANQSLAIYWLISFNLISMTRQAIACDLHLVHIENVNII